MRAPEPTSFRGYFPEFDGLRGIMVLLVMLDHYLNIAAPRALHLAWTFMDTFFVMSGFLVGGILLDARSEPDYYRRFYWRRALRILPLYYLLLVGMMLYGRRYDPSYSRMLQDWGSPLWFFVYLGSIPMALTGKMPPALDYSFGPLWSLQIEEQFYILAPFLVRLLRVETLAKVLFALPLISLVLRIGVYAMIPENQEVQFVLLPLHMDGLALGVLLALWFRREGWSVDGRWLTRSTVGWWLVTLSAGSWAGYGYWNPFNRTVGLFLSSVASAHLILWLVVNRGSPTTRVLRWGPLRYLGMICYGLYLLHLPVRAVLSGTGLAAGVPGGTVLAPLVVTVLVASLSWRWLESPLLRWRDRPG